MMELAMEVSSACVASIRRRSPAAPRAATSAKVFRRRTPPRSRPRRFGLDGDDCGQQVARVHSTPALHPGLYAPVFRHGPGQATVGLNPLQYAYVPVAQRIEHSPPKRGVAGPIPAGDAIFPIYGHL